MKAFGRLLLATALIVPAGFMTAQSAGATPKPEAKCTGNAGTLHLSPGVRLSQPVSQTVRNFTSGTIKSATNPGTVSGCTGVGIAGSTGGTFAFQVARSAVTCKSIRGTQFVGTGRIVWDSKGSNAGIRTDLKVRITFNSYVKITFAGTVTGSSNANGKGNGYLLGEPLSGTASIPPTMRPVGTSGGACQNHARVKSLPYTQTSDLKL
jgi:hypothetical protein